MSEPDSVLHLAPMNHTALLEQPATGGGHSGIRPIPPAGSATLVRACRDIAVEGLVRLTAHTLDRVDDALFELADKAENNAQQRAYFDAMRDARLRRAGVETAFKAHLLDRIDRHPGTPGGGAERSGGEGPGGVTLGLVENDELEVSLAVSNMVAKARGLYEDELYALDCRIGHLLGEADLEGVRNPFGPESLCVAFRQACESLDPTLTVKLLILKLFDKYVVSELADLYRGLNQHLADRNILPNIQRPTLGRPVVRPTRPASAHGRSVGGSGTAPAGLEPDVMALLQELAAATRPGQAMSLGSLAGGGGGGYPEVLGALTQLQGGHPVSPLHGVDGLSLEPALVAAGTVNVLRELRVSGFTRGMDQVDDLMLEVVTLLFDYVLDDKAIPAALKALIGRLQIPLLKVAILDKALFARKSHPARRLLNTVAEAAVGWDETRDCNDELFHAVERVVQRVLTEFDQNVELFSELLAEFEGFLAAQEQRAQQRAELSVKILQGRERLDLAKAVADAEVQRCLALDDIPPPVREFVDHHWRNLLVVTHNREGESSELWQKRVQMMETLLWSVTPKRTPGERRELLGALPPFVRGLNETIRTIGMGDEERERFVAMLARCQATALKGEKAAAPIPLHAPAPTGPAPAPPPVESEPDTTIELIGPATFHTEYEGADGDWAGTDALPGGSTRADDRAPLPAGLEEDFEEIVIEGVAAEAAPEPVAPPPPENDAYLEAAQTLAMGTWVEFQNESGTRTRARLTWVSSVTGVYLFTDRKGMKVAERTPAGLAADFRRASARVMESVPLFDRAVSHLMKGLRRSPNPAP